MSEHEGGESRTTGAFLLGFLLGVLVSLGAAGSLWFVMSRQALAQAREAEMRARQAQEEALREADRARLLEMRARQAAEEAAARAKAEKARAAKEKKGEE
jgi:uncharacterized protein HemX